MTISNVIIPSTQLRERVKETVSRDMGGYFNSFGYAACEAAYKLSLIHISEPTRH